MSENQTHTNVLSDARARAARLMAELRRHESDVARGFPGAADGEVSAGERVLRQAAEAAGRLLESIERAIPPADNEAEQING